MPSRRRRIAACRLRPPRPPPRRPPDRSRGVGRGPARGSRSPWTGSAPLPARSTSSAAPPLPWARSTSRSSRSRSMTPRSRPRSRARTRPPPRLPRPPTTSCASTSRCPGPRSTPTSPPAWRWCRTARRRTPGVAIGAAAADEMIASRVGDGRNDPSIAYTKTAALGIWPAAAPPGMALPWLGFVDPVVDVEPVALDGPDPTRARPSPRTTRRSRTLGSVAGTDRTLAQTAVAQFFSANPMLMYRNALCELPRRRAARAAAHDPALRPDRRRHWRRPSSRPGG